MERNYTNYNAVQFAADSFFLQWQMVGDDESNEFWETFRKEHPEKESNIQDAIRIVESVRINDIRFSKEEMELQRQKIRTNIKQKARHKRNILLFAAVAASFTIIVVSYILVTRDSEPVYSSENQPEYQPKPNKEIVLTLPGDSVIAFAENTDVKIDEQGSLMVSGSNQKTLFSTEVGKLKESSEVQMSKLVVPYGKRSSLMLADGSKIWINSGSTLQFPSVFNSDQRLIKVEGEIYIEVARNAAKPFIVNTGKFNVTVTGTIFNVTAYNDDKTQGVVLVEGTVRINAEDGTTMSLEPNDRFSLTNEITEKQKVDVYDYISWKDGIYRFAGDSLENILIRLSRYYDVNLACSDDVKNMQLRGKLALMDDLTSVLDNIEVIVPIKYEIQNDRILISKK